MNHDHPVRPAACAACAASARPAAGARPPALRAVLMVMLLGLLLAIGGAADASAPPPRYVDALDYPANGEGWAAFGDLERRLEHDFDQICGDTFCEGDYSDYRPLRLRCSVTAANGVMRRCLWLFAASELSADPATGRLRVDARVWRCPVALPRGLALPELLAALSGPSPLFEPLPRGGKPIYENLIDCL